MTAIPPATPVPQRFQSDPRGPAAGLLTILAAFRLPLLGTVLVGVTIIVGLGAMFGN